MIGPFSPDPTDPAALGARLNEVLGSLGENPLDGDLAGKFGQYAALLIRWNARTNLTAVRDADGIIRRHFAESIYCARALPLGIGTLLDIGSGAGFPGIPIALCRTEIAVTLAESQGKKAAFLQEALRVLQLRATVHCGRAEAMGQQFDCVTLRAVDRMRDAVQTAGAMVTDHGMLSILTTKTDQARIRECLGQEFDWTSRSIPGTPERVVLIGERLSVPRGTV